MPFDYEKQPVKAVVCDVTATRALDTVYQNTSGRPKVCVVSLDCIVQGGFNAYGDARVGTMTPPTPYAGESGFKSQAGAGDHGAYFMLTFLVPNNNYYRIISITSGTSTIALKRWNEVEL